MLVVNGPDEIELVRRIDLMQKYLLLTFNIWRCCKYCKYYCKKKTCKTGVCTISCCFSKTANIKMFKPIPRLFHLAIERTQYTASWFTLLLKVYLSLLNSAFVFFYLLHGLHAIKTQPVTFYIHAMRWLYAIRTHYVMDDHFLIFTVIERWLPIIYVFQLNKSYLTIIWIIIIHFLDSISLYWRITDGGANVKMTFTENYPSR